ncbi:hypothetical protein [Salinarimonas chemoclinalis]|uniref:hypothetical protein n=1 Tax=Salinarimonas chemoclinalis TaxID=3241599 RepID=UPI0035580BCB
MADDERARRLKAALRENLKRRKAQSRVRATGDAARQDAGAPAAPDPEPCPEPCPRSPSEN